MTPYQRFVTVYDQLMDETLYEKWVDYVVEYVPKSSSILELACGSGLLGIQLKKRGHPQVTGLDVSSDMLTLASENQKKFNVHFPLVERDMKDLSELPYYDTVISFNDSLCYLRNQNELKKVFEEVYKVLNTNGVFLFDVHSILQMENFIGYSYHNEVNDTVFLWDSYEGEFEHSIEHDLSFFIRQSSNIYERFDEQHKERTYSINTYLELLKETGFQDITVTGDFSHELKDDSLRWFFKALKRG